MGNEASKIKTLQIVKVSENSISDKNKLLPFMHTILKYNNKPLTEKTDVLEINQEWESNDLNLELMDLRTDTNFEITIPKKNNERLGIGVKLHEVWVPLFTVQILSIVSGSPADVCGLVPKDYILGVENVGCETEDELLKYIEAKKKDGMVLIVFNLKLKCLRKVEFKVSSGLGFFGCEIGLGILYKIPGDPMDIDMVHDNKKIQDRINEIKKEYEEPESESEISSNEVGIQKNKNEVSNLGNDKDIQEKHAVLSDQKTENPVDDDLKDMSNKDRQQSLDENIEDSKIIDNDAGSSEKVNDEMNPKEKEGEDNLETKNDIKQNYTESKSKDDQLEKTIQSNSTQEIAKNPDVTDKVDKSKSDEEKQEDKFEEKNEDSISAAKKKIETEKTISSEDKQSNTTSGDQKDTEKQVKDLSKENNRYKATNDDFENNSERHSDTIKEKEALHEDIKSKITSNVPEDKPEQDKNILNEDTKTSSKDLDDKFEQDKDMPDEDTKISSKDIEDKSEQDKDLLNEDTKSRSNDPEDKPEEDKSIPDEHTKVASNVPEDKSEQDKNMPDEDTNTLSKDIEEKKSNIRNTSLENDISNLTSKDTEDKREQDGDFGKTKKSVSTEKDSKDTSEDEKHLKEVNKSEITANAFENQNKQNIGLNDEKNANKSGSIIQDEGYNKTNMGKSHQYDTGISQITEAKDEEKTEISAKSKIESDINKRSVMMPSKSSAAQLSSVLDKNDFKDYKKPQEVNDNPEKNLNNSVSNEEKPLYRKTMPEKSTKSNRSENLVYKKSIPEKSIRSNISENSASKKETSYDRMNDAQLNKDYQEHSVNYNIGNSQKSEKNIIEEGKKEKLDDYVVQEENKSGSPKIPQKNRSDKESVILGESRKSRNERNSIMLEDTEWKRPVDSVTKSTNTNILNAETIVTEKNESEILKKITLLENSIMKNTNLEKNISQTKRSPENTEHEGTEMSHTPGINSNLKKSDDISENSLALENKRSKLNKSKHSDIPKQELSQRADDAVSCESSKDVLPFSEVKTTLYDQHKDERIDPLVDKLEAEKNISKNSVTGHNSTKKEESLNSVDSFSKIEMISNKLLLDDNESTKNKATDALIKDLSACLEDSVVKKQINSDVNKNLSVSDKNSKISGLLCSDIKTSCKTNSDVIQDNDVNVENEKKFINPNSNEIMCSEEYVEPSKSKCDSMEIKANASISNQNIASKISEISSTNKDDSPCIIDTNKERVDECKTSVSLEKVGHETEKNPKNPESNVESSDLTPQLTATEIGSKNNPEQSPMEDNKEFLSSLPVNIISTTKMTQLEENEITQLEMSEKKPETIIVSEKNIASGEIQQNEPITEEIQDNPMDTVPGEDEAKSLESINKYVSDVICDTKIDEIKDMLHEDSVNKTTIKEEKTVDDVPENEDVVSVKSSSSLLSDLTNDDENLSEFIKDLTDNSRDLASKLSATERVMLEKKKEELVQNLVNSSSIAFGYSTPDKNDEISVNSVAGLSQPKLPTFLASKIQKEKKEKISKNLKDALYNSDDDFDLDDLNVL